MTFLDAMKWLRDGLTARRDSWDPGFRWTATDGRIYEKDNAFEWYRIDTIHQDEIEARDWNTY
jgi:hypothetical protein